MIGRNWTNGVETRSVERNIAFSASRRSRGLVLGAAAAAAFFAPHNARADGVDPAALATQIVSSTLADTTDAQTTAATVEQTARSITNTAIAATRSATAAAPAATAPSVASATTGIVREAMAPTTERVAPAHARPRAETRHVRRRPKRLVATRARAPVHAQPAWSVERLPTPLPVERAPVRAQSVASNAGKGDVRRGDLAPSAPPQQLPSAPQHDAALLSSAGGGEAPNPLPPVFAILAALGGIAIFVVARALRAPREPRPRQLATAPWRPG